MRLVPLSNWGGAGTHSWTRNCLTNGAECLKHPTSHVVVTLVKIMGGITGSPGGELDEHESSTQIPTEGTR